MENPTTKRILLLKRRIEKYKKEIDQIQTDCAHPKENVTKTYGSNTGNYCPQDDIYWTRFVCSVCQKCWTEYKTAG